MNFLKKIVLLFFLALMVIAGSLFLAVALKAVPVEKWGELVSTVYDSNNWRIALGAVGGILLMSGIGIFLHASKNMTKSKLITFHNPDGEVTVALSAIENYVTRVAKDIAGIQDARAEVKASKRGINISSFVTLEAGTNVPEVTERIQLMVKSKIQDMIGVEERITIKMHINKITKGEYEEEGVPVEEVPEAPTSVPFR